MYCRLQFTYTRLDYPGACSLEYQNQVQILIACLLHWDIKKQKVTRKGILGTLLAFVPGDEEQGRGTLHLHWQCWLVELSQRARNFLFAKSKHEREKARADFLQHVDAVLNASYGSNLIVTHNCINEDGAVCQRTNMVEDIFF